MNMIKDAHIHLSFLSDEQIRNYFSQAEKLKITGWILGGYDEADWLRQIEIKKLNSRAQTCFGLHPWVVEKSEVEELNNQWKALESFVHQADAIGETGIDRFRSRDDEHIKKQLHYFRKSLELATAFDKPVVLHIVQAHELALNELDQFPESFGVAHSFSGSYETACEYIKRGYFISIGPTILGEGHKQLKEALPRLSLDHLLIESDSPRDLALPAADPQLLLDVAGCVAQLINCEVTEVLSRTSMNFDQIFKAN